MIIFWLWLVGVSKFCEDWAQVLFEKLAYSLADAGDVNPADLKTINENFKLKVGIFHVCPV